MFIHDKAHRQSVCAHLKCFIHRIHSSQLWSSEKWPVHNTQSASCSSSSVESSATRTARSASESDGVSNGVGSQQTLFFRLFEGPRRAFDASWLVLDLVACLIFWVASTNFCKLNSLFPLLFHHEYLAVGSGLAQGWCPMLGEPQQKWTAKN